MPEYPCRAQTLEQIALTLNPQSAGSHARTQFQIQPQLSKSQQQI